MRCRAFIGFVLLFFFVDVTLPSGPPRVRVPRRSGRSIDLEAAGRAVETVRAALEFFVVGPPIVHRGPAGDVHVDVPLMYHDFALDRVHFDPVLRCPSPKGRPGRAWGVEVSVEEVREVMERVLSEVRVVDAAEFREPEDAWVVPLAWRHIIIAHIRVSSDGEELIPDYGLTEEVRRHVF